MLHTEFEFWPNKTKQKNKKQKQKKQKQKQKNTLNEQRKPKALVTNQNRNEETILSSKM